MLSFIMTRCFPFPLFLGISMQFRIWNEFVTHAGQLCGLEEIVGFMSFPRVVAAILGKISDNEINGSLFDTLVHCAKIEEIDDQY